MARRLNTRFLTIMLLVVAVVATALILAEKFLIHEHPDRYIELGKQAMADRKWQEAAIDFSKAAKLSQTDPQIQMLLAGALKEMAQSDPQATQMEIGAFTQALEINPKFLPALKALSDFYTTAATQSPRADLYRNAIDYTQRAHDVDPADEKLQSLHDRLVIQQWSSGFEPNRADVDKVVKEMKDLWQKNPADAELPYSLATAEIEAGVSLAGENSGREQPKEVTDHYNRAVSTFESVLLAGGDSSKGPGPQDKNAVMHYDFARVLERLSALDQSSPDAMKKYQNRASVEVGRAIDLVKPNDPDYLTINEYAADLALRRGDRDGAVAIYKKMPTSPLTHLALADILSRSQDTQAEAVKLLKDTLSSLGDDPNHMVFYGIRFALTLEMTKVQVFQYLEMPSSPEKTKAHDDIRATLDKLNSVAGFRTSYPLKDVEARFQIGSGLEDEMHAVQSLSKLLSDSPPPARDYYSYTLQTLLAQGYEDTGQSANALTILKLVVQQFPRDVAARKHLIGLLMVESPEQARVHIDELARLSPNDPALNLYRIEMLLSDPDKNKERIEKFYSELKETGAPQMSAKAKVALQIKNYDDAMRLLKTVTSQDPSRVDDWLMLTRIEYLQGKKDDALATAKSGLAANPKDPRLRLLIPQIQGEGQKAIDDLQAELAKENPDKSQGELVLAGLASRRGDVPAEGQHLETALKYSPESSRIEDMLFNYYLHLGKFDRAAKCIPSLAKVDADRAGGELYRLALAEAQRDSATAEAIARRLTQDKPEFARSWLAMGDVLQNEGQYQQAIPQYNNCLQKESNLTEGYIGLARCYFALHQTDNALHTIEEGLKRLPGEPTLKQMKLSYEISFGDPDEATKEIKAEIESNPDPRLYAALAEVLLRYSDTLRKNNQAADAVKEAQVAVDNLKDPLTQWPDEKDLYVTMAEAQVGAKHPDDAEKTLQAWAERDAWKKDPQPYLALAEFYERFGLADKAEEQMTTAMKRSGYRPEIQVRMASLLSLHKKNDQALELLRSVNADNPSVQEKIIQVLLVDGKFDEAQKVLAADLAANPPNAETLQATWALASYEHGLYQDAVDHSTAALAINPKSQTALFCRARAYMRLQPPDPQSALRDLVTVREASPNNIEVRLSLADADLMLNQADGAAGELQAGIRALPNNKQLRMRLVSLYVNGPHPRLSEALKLLTDVENVPPFNKDPDIFENESVILARMGDSDDALGRAERALQLSPDNPAIVRTDIQLQMDSRNYQAVVDHCGAMSDKMKASSWALWDLALAEKRLDNPQSLTDFNRALAAAEKEDLPVELDSIAQSIAREFTFDDAVNALTPISKEYVSAKISLARLYQIHGDDASALATVDEVMANFDSLRKQDQVNILSNGALMYQTAKPPLVDKAYESYMRWVKIEPDNLEALNNLACLLADNYSPPRAAEGLEFANRAIKEMSRLGRTEPRLLDTQAWLLILSGSAEEGVDILNKAMSDFDPIPEEYLHLGEGYLRKGSPDPAQAETQAKLGLQMVNRRNAGARDADVRAKLQDLVNRSEDMRRTRQQAQTP